MYIIYALAIANLDTIGVACGTDTGAASAPQEEKERERWTDDERLIRRQRLLVNNYILIANEQMDI